MNTTVSSVGARAARTPACASQQAPETAQLRVRTAQLPVVAPWLSDRSALFALCLRWTRGDVSEAEDLLGDACLRILEGGQANGDCVMSPIAFWATVINNLGRDRVRRRRRWNFDYRGSDAGVLQALPSSAIGAEQQMFLKERLAATDHRLMQLTEKQRNAVLLRSSGLEYAEIGEALGTSSASSRKLVESARKALIAPLSRLPRKASGARRRRVGRVQQLSADAAGG